MSRRPALRRLAGAAACLVAGALVGGVGLLVAAGGAAAAGAFTVRPIAPTPGDLVTVRGACPAPENGDFVRATVGIASLERYVVVPVTDGSFRARVPVSALAGDAGPEPGDRLTVAVSCATDASFVSPVGTRTVRVVSDSERSATNQARRDAAAQAEATGAAAPVSADESMSPLVPLVAFLVAAVGTLAAFAASRRSDRRAEAMAGHPAHRGLGRAPRRARR